MSTRPSILWTCTAITFSSLVILFPGEWLGFSSRATIHSGQWWLRRLLFLLGHRRTHQAAGMLAHCSCFVRLYLVLSAACSEFPQNSGCAPEANFKFFMDCFFSVVKLSFPFAPCETHTYLVHVHILEAPNTCHDCIITCTRLCWGVLQVMQWNYVPGIGSPAD